MNSHARRRRRCSCARDGGCGWLPCPFLEPSCDLNAAVIPAATPRNASNEWGVANGSFAAPYSPFAKLLLLAGDRLGRPLARPRIGVGALTAHRQAAAMTQAPIAAEIHQPLDVDAGLAAKIALDDIVAVDHFADLQNFLVAQLIDPAILGDLDLFDDLGRALLADAMDVLKRDQDALVGGDVHAGNTGHEFLSCRRSLTGADFFYVLLSRAGVRKREHDALPRLTFGARHRHKTIRLGCAAY